MPQWTAPQRTAIEDRGHSLLVAAAAGAGKTAVLVERVIRLLEEGGEVDRMLIVTFTNAAAAEMRERIAAALSARQGEGQEAHLRRQLANLPHAQISTLHEFCVKLLRNHFHIAGIDASFRVADEAETEVIRAQALEEALDAACDGADADFIALLDRFGDPLESLEGLVREIHNRIQAQPDPKAWLVAACDEPADLRAPWAARFARTLAYTLEAARASIHEAVAHIGHIEKPDAYLSLFAADAQMIGDAAEAAKTGLPELLRALTQIEFGRLPGKKLPPHEVPWKDMAKDARDAAKKLLEPVLALAARKPEEWAAEQEAMGPCLRALCRLVLDYDARYGLLKADHAVLDFNDLEHLALAVLARDDIAGDVRETFDHIFVDEYQDTNAVQEAIVGRIARAENRFSVGDVKQSIYRFRLADPGLFLNQYESCTPDGPARAIDLNRNFRSQPVILEAVNRVFSRIMRRDVAEMEYDDRARLYPGREADAAAAPVELCLIERTPPTTQGGADAEAPQAGEGPAKPDARSEGYAGASGNPGHSGASGPADADGADGAEELDLEEAPEIAELEALFVAQRIQEWMKQSIADARAGGERPLRYGDIAILIRANTWSAQIVDVLMRMGIPTYADAGAGYFEATEVRVALDLLRVLDNRQQDLSLIAVLRHIADFSTEDLAGVRAAYPDGSYFEAATAYAGEKRDELAERLRAFFERIARWRQDSLGRELSDLVWKILEETGYYDRVALMPGGLGRQANLRHLAQSAASYSGQSRGTLSRFLRFVEKLRGSGGDISPARLMADEDVVRVMTIHKSKGLEFPVVFLVGLGRGFNHRDERGAVLLHQDEGVGSLYVDPELRIQSTTLKREAIKARKRAESMAEEMRVLYVAMTRAMERLVLVGSVSGLTKAAPGWREQPLWRIARAGCFLDWIAPCALSHPDGEDMRMWLLPDEGQGMQIEGDASRWRVSILDRDVLEREMPPRTVAEPVEMTARLERAEAMPLEAVPEWIRERVAYVYPHGPAPEKKVSVSALVRAEETQARDMVDRPRFLQRAGLTPRERGTATHAVLQGLQFGADFEANCGAEIRRQMERMVREERLTAQQAQGVRLEQLEAFFGSDVGRRMMAGEGLCREKPFTRRVQVDGEWVLVQGVMDACWVEDGEWVLLDYKTDRIHPDEETVVERYREQLRMYREALEALTGMRVRQTMLYLFETGRSYDFGDFC